MKTKLVSIALAAACSLAQAGLVASDNFDGYAAGGLSGKNGGSGWAGAWTAPNPTTVAAVNAVADVPMSGNAIRFAPNASTAAAQRSLATAVNAAAVAVEFMFQFDAGTINDNDFLALWFGSSTGPNIGLKGNCGSGTCPTGTTSGADLFVRTFGNTNTAAYSTPVTVGQTYTLFGLLEKTGASAVYNQFSLWVDPSAGERSTLTGADAVFTGASSLTSFSTIGFRTVNMDNVTGNRDAFLVDNLSISVVPEPASLALVGLALMGAGIASRRRKG